MCIETGLTYYFAHHLLILALQFCIWMCLLCWKSVCQFNCEIVLWSWKVSVIRNSGYCVRIIIFFQILGLVIVNSKHMYACLLLNSCIHIRLQLNEQTALASIIRYLSNYLNAVFSNHLFFEILKQILIWQSSRQSTFRRFSIPCTFFKSSDTSVISLV